MRYYKTDILSFFDDEMKCAIKDLCKMINSSQADVFVLMAHKAVLLFQVLLDQGYIHKSVRDKIIVTHLSLGFDKSYIMPDMKVAIVDDIVISGTTIASAVHELIQYGIDQDSIDVYTIALDKKYFNMRFDKKSGEQALHYGIMMDDAKCIELSAVVSKAFSYLGIPYDVDFPVYQQIKISESQVNRLYNNLLWNVTDISNQNQISGGITALSLLPSEYTRKQIWSSVGFNLEECVDLKMRLYIEKYRNGEIVCCAVPMCLFREISESHIVDLYDRLSSNETVVINNTEASLRSKTRFVGYYLSHYIFTCFRTQMNIGTEFKIYEELVEVLFGPKYGNKIHSVLTSIKTMPDAKDVISVKKADASYSEFVDEYMKSEEYEECNADSLSWSEGSDFELGFWINYFILHPVIWWYREKEIKTRITLKDNSYHYVKNYNENEIEKLLHRLQRVIPMGLLIQLLKERAQGLSENESKQLISVFLDRAIDEGVIVPTLYYDENRKSICRAYRHGEDLPFGDADRTRLVYFLQILGNKISAFRGMDSVQISAIALEKIIVLFYQIGLYRGGIFNRFLGFDNTDIIHSFLSIHGTIMGFTRHDAFEHIYSAKDESGDIYITWLTKWLSTKSLISYPGKAWEDIQTEDTDSTVYAEIHLNTISAYLTEERMSVISESVQGGIKSVADLISQWYTGMVLDERNKDFKKHITILTSCSNKITFSSAIATEIHYFSTYWKKQGRISLSQPDGNNIIAFLSGTNSKTHTDNTRKGLYSGKEKIEWHETIVQDSNTNTEESLVEHVIKESTSYLNSETDKSIWKDTWKGIKSVDVDNVSELERVSDLANAYLFFYYTCFLCLNSSEFWENGELPSHYDEYKSACLRYQSFDNYYFDKLECISKETDLNKKKAWFQELLDRTTDMSEQYCVEKIEEAVWRCDPSFTVRYKSCLIMEINAFESDILDNVFMQFWNNLLRKSDLPKNIDLTTINIIRFPDGLHNGSDEYVKYGIFCNPVTRKPVDSIENTHNRSTSIVDLLLSFYDEICRLLTAKVKQIRAILIPEISSVSGLYFTHNLKRNIDKSVRQFYSNQIQYIEQCFANGLSEQIVVCLDRYTNFEQDFFGEWDEAESGKLVQNVSWISEWHRFSRSYIRFTSREPAKKILYSQVIIRSTSAEDPDKGMGILVRCKDRIVCVSCNHIFRNNVESYYAVPYYNRNLLRFDLKLSENESVKSYNDDSDILPAEDEIIILEPCWDGRIPLDADLIVKPEDFSQLPIQEECSIRALNQDRQAQVYHFIAQDEVDKGYYQLKCKDNIDEELDKSGWSGGVYFQKTNSLESPIIIGIHEGRFDDYLRKTRMIPGKLVVEKINKLLGDDY